MSDSYVSEELLLVWLLLIITVITTYIIQRNKIKTIPPASCAMILGILVGIIARAAGIAKPLRFSPAAFFFALLPPIVFQAGFAMKKKSFFKNFGAIVTYAGLGTLISALTFAIGTYFLYLLHIISHKHIKSFVQCLMYGAAISSIDPVATLAILQNANAPPVLYSLVFGESVLNDAVAIVLFRSLTSFYDKGIGIGTIPALALQFCLLFFGSLFIGVGVSLAAAFLLKRFQQHGSFTPYDTDVTLLFQNNNARSTTTPTRTPREGEASVAVVAGDSGSKDNTNNTSSSSRANNTSIEEPFDGTIYEIAIVVLGSYLAYLIAEVAGMSGIVALFFAGLCHAHYSYYNVSIHAAVTLSKFFEFAAFLCEIFVMAYLGIQVATNRHSYDFGLLISAIPLALASRAANVFPCSRLINTTRQYKLPYNLQCMLWAVGLRGAVAYGLVINMPRPDNPDRTGIPAIETATLLIVVVSTLVLGSATVPLLKKFELEGKDDADLFLYGGELDAEERMALAAAATSGSGGGGGGGDGYELGERSKLYEKFKQYDEQLIKPLFGGRKTGRGRGGGGGGGGGEGLGREASLRELSESPGHV